ncbi:ABC transporter ATP-binding protein [Virgibacillus pantothenticus]|uniref:ABC transporter ATP-binding protein n=1 Tax=Virgibacillus TaxID=84406 RepID=UPI00090AC07D|nr:MULTISPECIES: ABC transporter ATP-binding protein [Virgibacillus]API93527.1 ABC transporter ATP-binding protein [Virgibacillus sp. 6R]MBS7430089.1 ABC transporter ATP-binding protein [Virgibacillus sp. 19R1-5]MBU8566333.1 ABC transporter ATP-binding protein [Virgibacillus pantothenticus]MBU8600756.1 ABC transporter ATP-binding protein [Virgibacillus pantothenticus]MBU8634536.1 ABC transporter ATP-binding protein [Virgibacillus pantothenticus]
MGKLQVQKLTKSFGSNQVLNQLSFSIQDGEFVSILGPSGSGKSTLFNLIGGIMKPDAGSIRLNDRDITGLRGNISYMPQAPSLFPWRTVLQNVLLGEEIANGKADEEEARAMIMKAGLQGYEHAYPHELSGGMKQRVSFLRSMKSPQSLICLDEPFSALDEFTRAEMQKWLLSIWDQHRRSVLFVTHNIEEALFLSDRIIVLSQKPAAIKKELVIPFARPREEELVLSNTFLDYKTQLYYELRE